MIALLKSKLAWGLGLSAVANVALGWALLQAHGRVGAERERCNTVVAQNALRASNKAEQLRRQAEAAHEAQLGRLQESKDAALAQLEEALTAARREAERRQSALQEALDASDDTCAPRAVPDDLWLRID